MDAHPLPPFDPWLSAQSWSETWWAGVDPAGLGARFRAQRLARLIEVARRDSPFYRRRHFKATCLEDFEPVGKAELMKAFDDWATDRRITRAAVREFISSPSHVGDGFLGDYLIWTSSGTTGEPGVFVQDARALAAYDAIDALRLRGSTPLQPPLGTWGSAQRFAFVGAIGGHFAGHVSLQRLCRLLPGALGPVLKVYSVLDPLEQVARELQALRPTVLITYPSCAAALAQLQIDGRLRLPLREVWVGGEQLNDAQRALLKRAFGCPVRNNYGASEFYSMAAECPHGRLHLNDDWVVLEPVDEQLQPVPVGTVSHSVLLTNLANLTQPLLRYRLSDRVRLVPEPCACGSAFPVIEVQGRADDTLRLADAQGRPVTILPLALETALEEGAQVTRFQVLCNAQGGLEIRFDDGVPEAPAAYRRTRQVLHDFLAQHGVHPHIVYSAESPLRERGSGKLLRVMLRTAHARMEA